MEAALEEPLTKNPIPIYCKTCGAKLADTDGKTLIGPSFNLGKPSWLLCKCGAKKFWCPSRCDKIEVNEEREQP